MVCVQIRDHLKTAVEGNDLALDMFLQYPAHVAYDSPKFTLAYMHGRSVDTHANNRIPTS